MFEYLFFKSTKIYFKTLTVVKMSTLPCIILPQSKYVDFSVQVRKMCFKVFIKNI